ncbi:MAG TPA: LuxR C-terminal-related transcriptional regulator, partial [Sphingopyxis sp.]|nr:LuxR C-terminal-related transcriptional regulator [Sphingopyxis sp.]
RAEIRILLDIVLARVELASNRPAAALDHAESAVAAARILDRAQLAVTASILASAALDREGRSEEALTRLRSALDEAAGLGLARTFIDEARPFDALLRRIRQAAPLDAASSALLEEVLGPAAATGSDAATPTAAAVETPLTAREVEIVGLVAAGMSNKRIALTLQISVETVKWNLKNIFAKLGVPSRYDAMIWARRQGLID